MRVVIVHHNPTGVVTGALSMARLSAAALRERGHQVLLRVTPGTGEGVGQAIAGAPGMEAPGVGAVPGAGNGAGNGDGIGAGNGDGIGAADIVHLVDLVDPEGGRSARALAEALRCPLVVTPATDARLWRDCSMSLDVARSAAVVFALTAEEVSALAAMGVPSERILKITQGPALPVPADATGVRARLRAVGPLVLFLSRKLESKGYQHLLAAGPRIWARHPQTMLVFAGPDPDGTAAARLAAAGDGRVVDLGVVDEADKAGLLHAADLLCVPTVADSFPLVFTEAWWCGTPVVTGPFPGAQEVVRDGVDGRVVAAEATAVADAVADLLDEPEVLAAMARAGRLRARSELTWDRVVDQVEDGYRRALGHELDAGHLTRAL